MKCTTAPLRARTRTRETRSIPQKAFDTQDAATIGINEFGRQGCFCYLLGWHDGKDGIDFAKKNNKQTSPATAAGPGNITQTTSKTR